LTPYTAEDTDSFRRDDQVHVAALKWVRDCKDRVLYLTGVSGSGKSSILAAYVAPELRGQEVVVQLRASDQPLVNLRAALLSPGLVWQKDTAKRHEPDDTTALVRAAAEYLGRSGRGLLLVVDQFEEALVQDTEQLLGLLKSVAAGECPNCRAV